MSFLKNNFERKSIKNIEQKKKTKFISYVFYYFKWGLTIFFIFLIFYFWTNISQTLGNYIKSLTWLFVKNVSSVLAKEPQKDSLGNVNILLLGIGGKNHDGGYLTDSIIIASFNPKYKSLTFLSIPRDLYVKYDKYRGGRINYIFAEEYLKTKSYTKAAKKLEKKIKEITGVDINYYVVVDFGGFKKFIDELGGIKVYVKEDLVDYRYPGPNRTYTTFKISKGTHILDGETALKYARSRHSTSDFSRSERQEQIIKAIIHKLSSSGIFLSPRKLKALYIQFIDTIKTDFDFDTLLSFLKYAKDIKIHSYSINGDCFFQKTYWKNLKPGCFVYPAPRDDFNGQAVLLPVGSTVLNVDNYTYIKKFVFLVLSYPELWLENAKIQILNGISHKKIKQYYGGYLKPIASELAYKLKNYGFNVVDVSNSKTKFDKTTGYIYSSKPVTEDLLKNIIGEIDYKRGDVKYSGKGFDLTLVLGNNYLNGIQNK